MAKYDEDDIATYYFVIVEDNNGKRIQAWSDSKGLVKYYTEFHKCKNFKIKSLTRSLREISSILEENLHDEIVIANLIVRNRNRGKNDRECKTVQLPLTKTELTYIDSEINTSMASRINYSYLNEGISYMKDKYKKALKDIFLLDVINAEIYGKRSKIVQSLMYDQLMVLLYSFPDNFGK